MTTFFFCCCCWRCFLDSSLTRQFKEIQQGPVLRLMESPPMMITTGVGEGKRERGGGQVSPAEEEPRTLVTSSMATDRLAVVSDAQRRWHVGWGRVDESASLSPPSLAPSLGCIFYIYFFVCVCVVSLLFLLSLLSPSLLYRWKARGCDGLSRRRQRRRRRRHRHRCRRPSFSKINGVSGKTDRQADPTTLLRW